MLGYTSRTVSRSIRHISVISARAMSVKALQHGAKHIFAPLKLSQEDQTRDNGMRLHGIVFDMDGTLCEPQNHMFLEMRAAAKIPPDKDILDHVHSLPKNEQDEAFAVIQSVERRAMETQTPQPGLVALMEYLDRKGIKKAICTRNFDAPVDNFLEKHVPSYLKRFQPIITRDFRPPKPSPAGVLHIAHAWGVVDSASIPGTDRSERLLPLLMVGDSIDDMISGHEAGALTVLLRSEGKEELGSDASTDVVISRLDELVSLLEEGLVPSQRESRSNTASL